MDKKILELEKSLFKVEYMTNIEYLNDVIADEYLEVGKSGLRFIKQDVVKELSALTEDRNITIYNYDCTRIDENTYLVHYITKSGEQNIFRTSIWKQDSERIYIIFHQASLYKEDAKLIKF